MENKSVFVTEKSQYTSKNQLFFVPFQKENFKLQTPATMVQNPKENR